MSKFCMTMDEIGYDLGAQPVKHVNAQEALSVQLVLLSNNCVFLRKPNGYWKFPDADRVAYDEARQLKPMEDLLDSLGMSANDPLLQYAVCKAVRCNNITMRVVILKVQRDLGKMQFEGGAFVGLGEVNPHSTNFSATTAKILKCISEEGWLEGLNVMQVSPSSSTKLPYRIILQCLDSKNIFLEPARVVEEKTGVKKDLGYSRLPGSTFETKQEVAVAHAQTLTCAIVGCVYSHEIWDVDGIRYVVVKVPGYGGQIRSDDHTATKYTYTFDGGKEGEGSFFSMEEIVRSRGHVATSTQNSIANLLLDPVILKK